MKADYSVDRARWAKLDIFNQMGNIYSEVGRSFKTLGQIDSEEHIKATTRAIDLFDATIESLIATKSPKSKEVLRAKEVYLGLVNNPDASAQLTQSLDRYFLQFAIAARIRQLDQVR